MKSSSPGKPAPRSFESEIRSAIRYERFLAVKALLALAIVAGIMTAHVLFAH